MRTVGQLGFITLLACCCAALYGVTRLQSTAPRNVDDAGSDHVATASQLGERATPDPEASSQTLIAESSIEIDSELSDYAAYKYRFLLADGSMNGVTLDDITSLLAQREATCRPDNTTPQCIQVESQLKDRLHPTDYARYALLKDSDAEQHHTTAYAEGIQHLAPLNAAQERALLETRLRMKEVYRVTARDAPPDVRLHALNQYQAQLLGELQSLLSDEQFALLSNYEQTEFDTVRKTIGLSP